MQPKILWITAGDGQAAPVPVETAPPSALLERLRRAEFDAVVIEGPLPAPGVEGLLDAVRQFDATLPALIRDPSATLADAVRLGRLGVRQFLADGPAGLAQLTEAAAERAHRSLAHLAGAVQREEWERMLVGSSHEMCQIGHLIRLVGPRRATVLITGESGTGKEVAARALHLAGPRRRGPFVPVNCSALPAPLLEAELFGHVRGAFTGAVQNRIGRFEQAHGGTLFLDEIGDLPLELQPKLLRVLQERTFERIGSSETIRTDVRVVAATNCDLSRQLTEGRFREDLFYRLNVVPLRMPTLAQHPGDVPALATHFLTRVCAAEDLPTKQLTAEALDRLQGYDWPGNVRQLENAIEMAVALSGDRRLLTAADFPLPARPAEPLRPAGSNLVVEVPDHGLDYERTLTSIERSILEQALVKTGGNKKAAAQMLHLKRTTLTAKIRTLAATASN